MNLLKRIPQRLRPDVPHNSRALHPVQRVRIDAVCLEIIARFLLKDTIE